MSIREVTSPIGIDKQSSSTCVTGYEEERQKKTATASTHFWKQTSCTNMGDSSIPSSMAQVSVLFEKSSVANSLAINNKRRLSAIDEICNKKMGRKMDTVYVAGDFELGCLEMGGYSNQTKEWRDSRIKMAVVKKDMLLRIIDTAPAVINDVHVIGYSTCTKGYVTRIRRKKEMTYPSSSTDYITCMVPLLHLAAVGKSIMEDTLQIFHRTRRSLTLSIPHSHPVLPPCFSPSSRVSCKSPSSKASQKEKGNEGSRHK
ncbi:uncharacterized protein BX664DRAFT_315990 [Halteromyces radiatus]|uniref:uncharacterized protein n=1 Tax=Halteromyces radiatus TaxID=101107 RepID=UPI00221E88A1|nr:uncharacterized protein BX664DRAFT_315990 [Halteromyces radiatus]KAI8084432.1 hypothetical protein BX664DRAFT_315990 [Halteromyces radiatus]